MFRRVLWFVRGKNEQKKTEERKRIAPRCGRGLLRVQPDISASNSTTTKTNTTIAGKYDGSGMEMRREAKLSD